MIERGFHRKLIAAGAAVLGSLTSACMTPTPYQPYRPEAASGVHGGYSDQQIAPGRFRVMFHGNELTSRDRVETYLLYRAAEVALDNGFDWFAIADRHTEHDVETYVRQPFFGGYGYWQPHWSYYRRGYGWDVWHPEYGGPYWADRIDVTQVESFEVSAEIVGGKGPVPSNDPKIFDARQVMARIGPAIELPRSR